MHSIREMTIQDYDQVIALWRGTESMTLRDADSKQKIAGYLERNSGLSFVALNEADIVGAVLVGTDGRRGYLQHLAVDKQFRNRKIGRELLMCSIRALEKLGIHKTHLFVHQDSVQAQRFYEQMGWFLRDDVKMYSYNSSSFDNI